MTSPVAALQTSLIDLIEALTPETDTRRTYKHLENLASLGAGSASMHRRFWFEPGAGGDPRDFGPALTKVRHAFTMVMAYGTAGLGSSSVFSQEISEAMAVMRAINVYTSLPSGVDYVRCTQYSIQTVDSDSDEIIFQIECDTQEA